eukprot:g1773.t1
MLKEPLPPQPAPAPKTPPKSEKASRWTLNTPVFEGVARLAEEVAADLLTRFLAICDEHVQSGHAQPSGEYEQEYIFDSGDFTRIADSAEFAALAEATSELSN